MPKVYILVLSAKNTNHQLTAAGLGLLIRVVLTPTPPRRLLFLLADSPRPNSVRGGESSKANSSRERRLRPPTPPTEAGDGGPLLHAPLLPRVLAAGDGGPDVEAVEEPAPSSSFCTCMSAGAKSSVRKIPWLASAFNSASAASAD
jgi:hypothetical protein